MHLILLSFSVLGLLIFFFWALRGSIFEISFKRRHLGGVFIFRELFLLISAGVLIFEAYGYEEFVTFYITWESLEQTSVVILLCLGTLLVTISFICKIVFKRSLTWDYFGIPAVSGGRSGAALLHACGGLLLLFVIIAHAAGMKHAFLQSILAGTDLMRLRLENKTEVNAPPHIIAYVRYLFQFTALLLGIYGSEIPRYRRFLILVLVLYAASLPGDKSPVVQVIFLYFVGGFRSSRLSTVAILRRAVGLFLVILTVIYVATYVQYPEMNFGEFVRFLFERLGIGQIQGVYEQFALRLQDRSYIFSEIPFSGIFGETTAFSKDLMAATYGYYLDRSDFGVMNSFFIGEAFAIGGWPLVWLSPIMVGINFCLIVYVMVRALNSYFELPIEEAKGIAALFISSTVTFTGDLGGLLLGKRLIVIMILLLFIYPIYMLAKKVMVFKTGMQ